MSFTAVLYTIRAQHNNFLPQGPTRDLLERQGDQRETSLKEREKIQTRSYGTSGNEESCDLILVLENYSVIMVHESGN